MSFPSIHEIVQSDFFAPEDVLRDKFPATSVERVLRLRALYNWVISNPDCKDKEFVDEAISRYAISKTLAYDDLKSLSRCCRISPRLHATTTDGSTMK